jgi:very-short-patch-repair endonuclease
MTLPEVLLWKVLVMRPGGLKFRRQHPEDELVDFYCYQARLCIEVDGEVHAVGDGLKRDARRDAWLRSQGIETLRLSAALVLKDMDAALD